MKKLLTIIMLACAVAICAEGVGIMEPMGGSGSFGNDAGLGGPGGQALQMGKRSKKEMRKAEKEREKAEKRRKIAASQVEGIVDAKKMYIYGIAYSPVDSVVYFTEISPLDSAQVTKKRKFLVNRNELSVQLKEYMKARGMGDRTCCVVFNKSESTLRKDYEKTQKKYAKRKFLVLHLEDTKSLFKAVRE